MEDERSQPRTRSANFGRSAALVVALSVLCTGASLFFIQVQGSEPTRHAAWNNDEEKMPADLNAGFEAVTSGNSLKLDQILTKSSKLANERSPWGASMLHLAAIKGNIQIVKILLAHHAKIDATDERGATPLDYAAFAGQESTVEFLIQQGADVNAGSDTGTAPLFYASMGSSRVDSPDTNYIGVCDLLIKAGAKINDSDIRGRSPIEIASEPVARFLFDHGASLTFQQNFADRDGAALPSPQNSHYLISPPDSQKPPHAGPAASGSSG